MATMVFQIIYGLAVVLTIIFVLWWLDFKIQSRCGRSFLSFGQLGGITIGCCLFYAGRWWEDSGDALVVRTPDIAFTISQEAASQGLIVLAGLVATFMVVQNIRQAGIVYGIMGTGLQAAFTYHFAPLTVAFAVLAVFSLLMGKGVPVGGGGGEQVVVYRRPPNVIPPP